MKFTPALCEGCPVKGMYRPVEPVGPEDARFLVVTDRPSMLAGREGRLMTSTQMGVFTSNAQSVGLTREDFRFTPMCHCPLDPDAYTNKQKGEIHKHCRRHLLAEIENGGSEVVVPLGGDAATQVFGRGTQITKVRGLPNEATGITQPVFPLMAPGLVVRYPQNAPLFSADFMSFRRFVDADYDGQAASEAITQDMEYTIVRDLQFLIDADPELLAYDTETTGLDWFRRGPDVRDYRPAIHKDSALFSPRFQILTHQFCYEPGKAYLLVWDHPEAPIPEQDKPRLRNQLRKLLCKPERIVVGANLKYDAVGLWMTEGIRIRVGGDVQMLSALIDENQVEKNLDILTKLHVPELAGYADRFNATVDKSRMWQTPLRDITPYGCCDTDAALRVYFKLEAEVADDERLWAHYCHISIPGINAFVGVESRGIDADETALAPLQALLTQEVNTARIELLDQLPTALKRSVVAEYCSKPANRGPEGVEKALSFTRADFLKQILYTHPDGFRLTPVAFTKTTARLKDESMREPSVSAKDALPYYFDQCPFTELLAEWSKDNSMLTKSIVSFREKYIHHGRIYPRYYLDITTTGRVNSRDPNGQNIPKRGARAKAYRKMFVAPPGYFICENDLSQAELRVAATMANEPVMLRIYREGGDIHRATAAVALNISIEEFNKLAKPLQKEWRQKAKAINFGFLYGMGWRKFIVYAKTQYGVVFSETEARAVRDAFFRRYSKLPAWHTKQREEAQRNKQVRSLSGRIRHLPMIDSSDETIQQEAQRQAINSPVQEFGSSLGVMAIGRLNEEIDPSILRVIGFVHDAIVYLVKKEYLTWGMRTVKRYMENNPLEEVFGFRMPLPIVADVGFGENLGEVWECPDFTTEGDYDYTGKVEWAEEGVPDIHIPCQRVPANDGRLTRSAYTTDLDMEDENVIAAVRPRFRMVAPLVSCTAKKRIEVGEKQVVINRRNAERRLEEQREERAVLVHRRRPTVT
jgi:uracil-DNA glycosylase family 4